MAEREIPGHHGHHPQGGADSAGTPWAGRHFEPNTSSDDDGSAPERLIEALRRFSSGELGESEVVDALRESRLLIPLVAHLGEAGLNEHGVVIDKTQELSIITVAGPDGRNVLPVFTSVTAMSHWNPKARPVPAAGTRVALAAASEHTELVVLDPTSPTEFVIRRPALWAIAQGQSWTPSFRDEAVLDAFADAAAGEPAVRSVALAAGDPSARLAGPELVVQLALADGLSRHELDAVVSRMQQKWVASEIIATRVDSMRVQLVSAS
ncbi:SseB family protein [Conyzicola nivalis]|uniref:SseB protein N-terminal domain-containing protein n=1 Tax=Conyzicola nivalis TaxID=1477021 RepID=A0A916WFV3_9MICO|nr:SseB family protein [Conyzicola nivalis]GGA93424.1 hypothetical protein GCM10010979_04980 [Conyzicola nivalis]